MSKNTAIAPATNPLAQLTKRLVFVGGGKGGVGKSACSRGLLEWYRRQGVTVVPWEGDDANPTMLRFVPDARRVISREPLGFAPLLNAIETDEAGCHVVDLGAGAETTLAKFDDLLGLTDSAQQLRAKVTFVFLVAPDPESIGHLPDLANRYGDRVDYVLARAGWESGAWDFWEKTKIRARLCTELNAIEISLSAVDGFTFSKINEASLTWSVAAQDLRLPFTSRAIAGRWLAKTCSEFDKAAKLLLP
jgi:hypothetical protein